MPRFSTSDRSHQIGQITQLLGALMIAAPTGIALITFHSGLTTSSHLFDPLPPFNPTALVARHPGWVAAVTAPLGLFVAIVGTAFLRGRSWARMALQHLCWLGAWFCVTFGALWALSLPGQSSPVIWFLGLLAVGMGGAFATTLIHVARELVRATGRQ